MAGLKLEIGHLCCLKAAPKDAMKLRTTGFEFPSCFVIRLAGGLRLVRLRQLALPPGPAIARRLCLGISVKFDEFPNQLWCGNIFNVQECAVVRLYNAKLAFLVLFYNTYRRKNR